MPLTGNNNNLIYLINSTVSSNTACSQKCVIISAVFKTRLNDCDVLVVVGGEERLCWCL